MQWHKICLWCSPFSFFLSAEFPYFPPSASSPWSPLLYVTASPWFCHVFWTIFTELIRSEEFLASVVKTGSREGSNPLWEGVHSSEKCLLWVPWKSVLNFMSKLIFQHHVRGLAATWHLQALNTLHFPILSFLRSLKISGYFQTRIPIQICIIRKESLNKQKISNISKLSALSQGSWPNL